jgi:histone-binding protein RBBP4
VNKARIMPQNSDFIATKTISGEIHIFNLNNHPDVPKNDNVYPELRLRGHETEGFGLSWSSKKEGYLVSGANDMNVCLYDVKSNNSNPIRTYKFHSDLVGDVAFSNLDENIFGSAGDDKKMMIYDIREEHPIFSVDAHSLALNCLDFNFFNKNLIITSSNDKLIALWDMRNLSRKLHTFDQHTKEVLGN